MLCAEICAFFLDLQIFGRFLIVIALYYCGCYNTITTS